jgi:hypothetical protein
MMRYCTCDPKKVEKQNTHTKYRLVQTDSDGVCLECNHYTTTEIPDIRATYNKSPKSNEWFVALKDGEEVGLWNNYTEAAKDLQIKPSDVRMGLERGTSGGYEFEWE